MIVVVFMIDYLNWLVVSIPLKNMKVSWDDSSHILWKVIKFHGSKPPTSFQTSF